MKTKIAFLLAFVFLFSSSALATIPDANVRQNWFDIGAGTAGFVNSASIAYGITDSLGIGVDYITADVTVFTALIPALFGREIKKTVVNLTDAYLNYQFVKGSDSQPFNVSVLLGGGSYTLHSDDSAIEDETRTMAIGGLCISAPIFTKSLVGRLDLISGPQIGGELAWKITDNFELNLGVSAMNIVGLKVSF